MAINTAIIRIRRGLKDELQIDKLVPGELAMATDAPVLWFCWAPGEIEQVPTSENITEIISEIVKEYLKDNPVTGISEIYMRVSGGYIQYSSDNETWDNLLSIKDITGSDGKTAYQYAQDGGYTGTEEEFSEKLAKEYPSKTSDLENDSGFITKAVSDLANYYLKSDTYSKSEINQKLSAIPKFAIQVVTSLPLSGNSTTVYLLKSGDAESNLYTEYIYVNGKWEYLGSQSVDLNDYALAVDIPTKVSQLTNDKNYLTSVPSEYITETELNAKGYLTQHQSLSGYAKTADHYTKIESDGKYQLKGNYLTAVPSEYVTETELAGKGYAKQTSVDSLSQEKVDYSEVDSIVSEAVESEKGNIVNIILQELQGLPVFGTVDENNTITVTSQLPDGIYTLKYETADGYMEVGTITIGNGEIITYTNLADPTSEYWKEGYRLNSSGSYVEAEYNTCTNWIPFTTGDVIRAKGIKLAVQGYNEGGEIVTGTNGAAYVRFVLSVNGRTQSSAYQPNTSNYANAFTCVNGIEIIDTSLITYASEVTHFCIVGILEGSAEDVVITINEEIA